MYESRGQSDFSIEARSVDGGRRLSVQQFDGNTTIQNAIVRLKDGRAAAAPQHRLNIEAVGEERSGCEVAERVSHERNMQSRAAARYGGRDVPDTCWLYVGAPSLQHKPNVPRNPPHQRAVVRKKRIKRFLIGDPGRTRHQQIEIRQRRRCLFA